jgi:hypothetical protein
MLGHHDNTTNPDAMFRQLNQKLRRGRQILQMAVHNYDFLNAKSANEHHQFEDEIIERLLQSDDISTSESKVH